MLQQWLRRQLWVHLEIGPEQLFHLVDSLLQLLRRILQPVEQLGSGVLPVFGVRDEHVLQPATLSQNVAAFAGQGPGSFHLVPDFPRDPTPIFHAEDLVQAVVRMQTGELENKLPHRVLKPPVQPSRPVRVAEPRDDLRRGGEGLVVRGGLTERACVEWLDSTW